MIKVSTYSDRDLKFSQEISQRLYQLLIMSNIHLKGLEKELKGIPKKNARIMIINTEKVFKQINKENNL